MLCRSYVMSCHVMKCFFMLCHVMISHVMASMPCYFRFCSVLSCYVTLRNPMSCHVICHMSYHAMPCHAMWCHVKLYTSYELIRIVHTWVEFACFNRSLLYLNKQICLIEHLRLKDINFMTFLYIGLLNLCSSFTRVLKANSQLLVDKGDQP